MYSGRARLAPGTPISVENNAQIVDLADKSTPYWYEVEYPDGRRELVSVARITRYTDDPRLVEEADGSVAILQPRLSREGACKLFERLRTLLERVESERKRPNMDT